MNKYYSVFLIVLVLTSPVAFIDIPEYTVYTATGDSMLPTHSECGISVIREDIPVSELHQKQDIVLVEHNESLMLHRFIDYGYGYEFNKTTAEKSLDDNKKYIKTKGDNNALSEFTYASEYMGSEVIHIDIPNLIC